MEIERFPPFTVKVVVPIFLAIFSALVRLLTLRLSPISVRGSALVPKEGGLIVLCNHLADLDPIMLQFASPRPIHFMAKADLFDWKVIGPILRYVKSFPVKRGQPDRTAIKTAIALAKAGEVVGIFPEGELSATGELLPLLPGVSLIIRQAGVPAICCRIDGTQLLMPYGQTVPRFRPGAKLTARWSEARDLSGLSAEEIMAWATANLEVAQN